MIARTGNFPLAQKDEDEPNSFFVAEVDS